MPFEFQVFILNGRCRPSNRMEINTITIKTIFGGEVALEAELQELGYTEYTVIKRAIQLKGTWKDVYFLNLHLRCAMSVLVEIAAFRIKDDKDLYKQAMKIDWTKYFKVNQTFAVKGAVQSTLFSHTQYPYLLVKDAIVDTFRKVENERPNVELKTPQLVFDIHIRENWCTISLNTSGAPLFQRGYRVETGEAPINEVTAAVLLRLSGWDRQSNFIDPFCGSGTILIEAALWAANIPSNIERTHYAFKNLKNFDASLWNEIYEAANRKCTGFDFNIVGSDIDGQAMLRAKRNLRGLPVGRFVELSAASFDEVKRPGEKGVLLCNPPYGERIGEQVEEMYKKLGDWFKQEMKGYACWVISSNEDALKQVGLKPDRKIPIYNGDLMCSFRKYTIFDGSHREFKTKLNDK